MHSSALCVHWRRVFKQFGGEVICVLSHNPQSKAQLTDLAAAIPEGELGKEGIWGVVKYMGNKAKR